MEECAATSDRKCADVDSGIEDRRQADTDKVDLCREGGEKKIPHLLSPLPVFLLSTWQKKIPQPKFSATKRVLLKNFICFSGAVSGHQDSLNVSIAQGNKSKTPIKMSSENRNTRVGIFILLCKGGYY